MIITTYIFATIGFLAVIYFLVMEILWQIREKKSYLGFVFGGKKVRVFEDLPALLTFLGDSKIENHQKIAKQIMELQKDTFGEEWNKIEVAPQLVTFLKKQPGHHFKNIAKSLETYSDANQSLKKIKERIGIDDNTNAEIYIKTISENDTKLSQLKYHIGIGKKANIDDFDKKVKEYYQSYLDLITLRTVIKDDKGMIKVLEEKIDNKQQEIDKLNIKINGLNEQLKNKQENEKEIDRIKKLFIEEGNKYTLDERLIRGLNAFLTDEKAKEFTFRIEQTWTKLEKTDKEIRAIYENNSLDAYTQIVKIAEKLQFQKLKNEVEKNENIKKYYHSLLNYAKVSLEPIKEATEKIQNRLDQGREAIGFLTILNKTFETINQGFIQSEKTHLLVKDLEKQFEDIERFKGSTFYEKRYKIIVEQLLKRYWDNDVYGLFMRSLEKTARTFANESALWRSKDISQEQKATFYQYFLTVGLRVMEIVKFLENEKSDVYKSTYSMLVEGDKDLASLAKKIFSDHASDDSALSRYIYNSAKKEYGIKTLPAFMKGIYITDAQLQ